MEIIYLVPITIYCIMMNLDKWNSLDAATQEAMLKAGHKLEQDTVGIFNQLLVDETAAMVWAANMAAIELHAPMALAEDLEVPRAIVFDFDPGAPAAMRECCEIALAVRAC